MDIVKSGLVNKGGTSESNNNNFSSNIHSSYSTRDILCVLLGQIIGEFMNTYDLTERIRKAETPKDGEAILIEALKQLNNKEK